MSTLLIDLQDCVQLRKWAKVDDGKPIYMLNLICYIPELHPFPHAPEFDGTPEEANA